MNNLKNILIRVCFAALLMFVSASAFAQQKTTVNGSVKDSMGEPVIGAAVLVEGTTNGVVTDLDGKYSITFTPSANSKLVFSSISYITETVEVAGRTVIDVVLKEDTELLEESVVVGYGSMRRSDITGSVTSVKIDETQAGQSSSIDQLLQGHAAGVQVVSNNSGPDAGITITVRGASSFNAKSQPLYVVDGIMMNIDAESTMTGNGGGDKGADEEVNGLIGISPNDIASIEILKDASATAIYGSQGANGVVLITTKGASREKPVITFSTGVDFSTLSKKVDILTTEQFPKYLEKYFPTVGEDPLESETYQNYFEGIASGRYSAVDWQDYTTRLAVSQRYYVSIAARPKDTSYRLSINYTNSQGIIQYTGMDNLTVRLNLDKTLGKFKFGTKSSISFMNSHLTQSAAGTRLSTNSSMVMSMLNTRPLKYNVDTDDSGEEFDDDDAPLGGPERWLTDQQQERSEIRVSPSLYGEYQILPWLSFKSTFGADVRVTEQLKFKSRRINSEATGSHGSSLHYDRLNWNWDNVLQINKKFGKHNISGTIGQSAFYKSTLLQSLEGTEVEQWRTMAASLITAPNTWLSYSEEYSSQLSFFGRFIYNYADRYVLTATYRADGSSKFAGKNKWAYFPSVAFAWRINQEPWFNIPAVSMAKLRLGWGISGNDGVPAYETQYTYGASYMSSHDQPTNKNLRITSNKLPSYDLRWESTEQWNVGLDLGLWDGRFTLEADAYNKNTYDLLQRRAMPISAGVSDPYVNQGSINNKGLEFTVSAVPVLTHDFEWSLGGNISFNRNKIISIDPTGASVGEIFLSRDAKEPALVEFFNGDAIGMSYCKDYMHKFIAGQPLALFYGLATNGIVQEGHEGVPTGNTAADRGPGSIDYVDVDGDGVITINDRCIIGDPNPDFTFGFNTSFRYKNWNLSAAFNGSYGNDIYNVMNMILSNTNRYSNNLLTDAAMREWSPTNPTAKYPKIGALDSDFDLAYASDRFVEDGSYLRFANLSLAYDVPFKNKNLVIKGLNLALSAKNLYVWTNYSGYDPDVNSFGSIKRKGCDAGAYPGSRTYMIDVKFTF